MLRDDGKCVPKVTNYGQDAPAGSDFTARCDLGNEPVKRTRLEAVVGRAGLNDVPLKREVQPRAQVVEPLCLWSRSYRSGPAPNESRFLRPPPPITHAPQ